MKVHAGHATKLASVITAFVLALGLMPAGALAEPSEDASYAEEGQETLEEVGDQALLTQATSAKSLADTRVTRGYSVPDTGNLVESFIEFYDDEDNLLVEGEQYRLEYSASHDGSEPLDPSEIVGRRFYYVRAVAIEGSGYTGASDYWDIMVHPVVTVPLDKATTPSENEYDDSIWVAVFTAPSADTYTFVVNGNFDPYATVSDAESHRTLGYASRTDSTSCSIKVALAAGQTVHVDMGVGEAAYEYPSLYVYRGKALGSFEGTTKFVFDGNPHMPEGVLYGGNEDDSSVVLRENVDYELQGFEKYGYVSDDSGTWSEWQEIAGEPTDPGVYMASYRGIGAYGGTRSVNFEIVDAGDLSEGDWVLAKTELQRGESISALGLSVTDASGKQLVKGVDYTVALYEYMEGYTYDEVPSHIGWYTVVVIALEQSGYTGELWCGEIEVVDPASLEGGTVELACGTLVAGDDFSVLGAKVTDPEGTTLVEHVDYELELQDSDGNPVSTMTDTGWYTVVAKAVPGGSYHDETPVASFLFVRYETIVMGSMRATQASDRSFQWYGSFTAPETGTYRFETQGDQDTDATLYTDKRLQENQIYDDEGGEDSNFRIDYPMTAGQTIYLEAHCFDDPLDAKLMVSKVPSTDLSLAKVTAANKTYTGKALKPAPKVVLEGKTLVAGQDYTVAYANNVKAGKASFTVTGMGTYHGTKKGSFTIAKAANGIKLRGKTVSVSATKLAKKAQTIKASQAVKVTGAKGALSYRLVKTSATKKYKVSSKGVITVPKGTKKGTHKVKVRVTAKGDANHKQGSKDVTVIIKVR